MARFEPHFPKTVRPAVYKLRYGNIIRYKLGLHAHDARDKWAKEIGVEPEQVEILDEGKKQ